MEPSQAPAQFAARHPDRILCTWQSGTAVWDAVACGVDAVSGDSETPRRVVVVITDGMDNSSFNTASGVEHVALENGVTVYAIGVSANSGLFESELREVTQNTGGGYFRLEPGTDLTRAFARVADELRHQYVFGFSPSVADPERMHWKCGCAGRV